MSLETLAAGRYTVTYGGTDIGIAEDGHTLSWQVSKEKVTNTDAYGDSDIDAVYRGMNVFLQTLCKGYKAGSVRPSTPYNSFTASGAANHFEMGLIGRLDTDVASTLVMTVVALTPAATAGPSTLTASEAILDANFNVDLFFGPRHRKVPIRWQLYPDSSIRYFTCT